MTSSESEEHAQQSRKRSRTSNSGDNGAGKKTRGRPRVDTHDATAADVSGYSPLYRKLIWILCNECWFKESINAYNSRSRAINVDGDLRPTRSSLCWLIADHISILKAAG